MIEILVAIEVQRAQHLPKTDLFSPIDPYIMARVENRLARTLTIQNNDAPAWNELIIFPAEVDPKAPSGVIQIELWDEDIVTDEPVGKTKFSLGELIKQGSKQLEAELTLLKKFKAPKSGSPTLWARLGYVLSFSALCERVLSVYPNSFVDEESMRLISPCPDMGRGIFIQFDAPQKERRHLSISILETEAPQPFSQLWRYDFVGVDDETRVLRRHYEEPDMRMGVSVYNEIRLEHLSPARDLRSVGIGCARITEIGCAKASEPLLKAGLKDGLNFKSVASAVEKVEGSLVDRKSRTVRIPHNGGGLELRFDGSQVQVAMIFFCQDRHTLVYDLELPTMNSERLQTPDEGGTRRVELTSIPQGSSLEAVQLRTLTVSPAKITPLLSLLPLWG